MCHNPTLVSVSVMAPNKIPFLDLAYGEDDVSIQNERLIFSKNISGNRVIIGSSVTDEKEEGEVVFQKGKYVISGEEIYIECGTAIERGVEVEFKGR